ncbi:MAG: hypothetical protein K2J58_02760 [Muribaculaceae bacterium]|nr:hypothetical protein [Muribaculaceae bacterium]
MADKSLVIDVKPKSVPSGSKLNSWSVLNNTGSFIRDIITPELTKKANVGALVSGIPTAFARVDLFNSAISADVANDTDDESGNLAGYYKELVSEWRGFIACIGLDYPNIKARRVNLTYSDGKAIDQTGNIYEPAGAFGNMLLERKSRWCDEGLSDNEIAIPYLNIVKYRNKVVGATSPETLLFTSSAYNVIDKEEKPSVNKNDETKEKPWIDVHTGKFIDPLKSDISEIELKTLYAYVEHICNRISNLQGKLGVGLGSVSTNLEKWLREMEAYASSRRFGVKGGAVPPVDAGFTGPFAKLLTFEDKLYVYDGVITEKRMDGAEAFDPKKLLLPTTAKITRIHLSPEYSKKPEMVKELPILLLTASHKGNPDEKAFFALPLSAQGLNVYSTVIESLVNSSEGTSSSKLTAIYDPELEEDNLEVELSIKTESGTRRYSKRYSVVNDPSMLNKDILIWPNFISKQWNQYYLYSELPHNSTANQCTTAYPFVGNPDDKNFRIITDDDMQPVLLAEYGEIKAPSDIVNAKLLITSGISVANNPYKYEIYRSDKPFKGIRLKAPSGEEGGYLLINYQKNKNSKLPVDMLQDTKLLKGITVGIDFGSTNTSVAYSDQDGNPQPFEFTNQRISLFGQELKGAKAGLQENRVLFFQAPEKPLKSNALHSILTIHDELRLGKKGDGEDTISQIGKEVIGGFPCFMDNLPVSHVSEESISLKYPKIGQIDQIHNMKWSNDEKDIARKKAYLRTLMLHIYAQMFLKDYRVPVQLRWSYPSSMSNQLLTKYKLIWDELAQLKPIKDEKGMEVPLRISTYQSVLDLDIKEQPQGRQPFGRTAVKPTEPKAEVTPQPPVATPAGTPDMNTMQQIQQIMQMQQQTQQMYMQMLSQPMPPEMMMQLQQQMQQQMQNFQTQIQMLMNQPQVQTPPAADDQHKARGFQQRPKPEEESAPQERVATTRGFTSRPTDNGGSASKSKGANRPDLRPDDPDRVVSYEPKRLFSEDSAAGNSGAPDQFGGSNISLTEANAVANFLSEMHGDSRDQLNICFDIGGSTTDITALYKLKEGITMVKQNSIRFAAQRVSRAVKYDKGFEKVLLKVCEKFGLHILGLNQGASRYNPDTASYYFDQIVDRLSDSQLPALYDLIAAECPRLMWVNMYVTGLLMYYAGQVAAKLIDDLMCLDPAEALPGERFFPEIRISFAGKGSRLYQWLSMTHPDAAKKYYDELFMQGYGDRDQIAGLFKIHLPTLDESKTIKYEVSMGLAKNSTDLCNPRYNTPSEIIGESGFSIVMADDSIQEISDTNTISPEMIEHIGTFFFPSGPNQARRFKEFCKIFDTATQQLFNIPLPKDFFESGTRNMNITQYVQTTPEFMRAKREKSQNKDKFDFVAPIIILEGMKFYDDHLLKPLKWASQES